MFVTDERRPPLTAHSDRFGTLGGQTPGERFDDPAWPLSALIAPFPPLSTVLAKTCANPTWMSTGPTRTLPPTVRARRCVGTKSMWRYFGSIDDVWNHVPARTASRSWIAT